MSGNGDRMYEAGRDGKGQKLIRLVEQEGIDVDAQNEVDWTALHGAAGNGHHDVVDMLVNRLCANVLVKDDDGQLPIHMAARQGYYSVVEVLLTRNANEQVDALADAEFAASYFSYFFKQATPLHFAAFDNSTGGSRERDYVKTIKLLIENGADIHAVTSSEGSRIGLDKATALHCAAFCWCREKAMAEAKCKALVDHGADLNVKDKKGRTPEQVARESDEDGSNEVADFLKKLSRTAQLDQFHELLSKKKAAKVDSVRTSVLGGSGAGKTRSVNRLLGKPFNPEHVSTQGVDTKMGAEIDIQGAASTGDGKFVSIDGVSHDDQFAAYAGGLLQEATLQSSSSSGEDPDAESSSTMQALTQILGDPSTLSMDSHRDGGSSPDDPGTSPVDVDVAEDQSGKKEGASSSNFPPLGPSSSSNSTPKKSTQEIAQVDSQSKGKVRRSSFSQAKDAVKKLGSTVSRRVSGTSTFSRRKSSTSSLQGMKAETIPESESKLSKPVSPQISKESICENPAVQSAIKKLGIMEVSKSHDEERRKLRIYFWDYAGQEVFVPLHIFYINEKGVYLVVFDMTKLATSCNPSAETKRECLDELRFWLGTLAIYAPDARALLIATHGDQVTDSNEHQAINKQLRLELRLNSNSQLVRDSEKNLDFWVLDNSATTRDRVDSLRQTLQSVIMKEPFVQMKVPSNWMLFYTNLKSDHSDRRCMNLDEFQALAESFDISGHEVFLMLSWFHELGFMLYFGREASLRNMVVLDPQWLLDACTMVIRDMQLHGPPSPLQDPELHAKHSHDLELLEFHYVAKKSFLFALWGNKLAPTVEMQDFLLQLMKTMGLAADYEFNADFLRDVEEDDGFASDSDSETDSNAGSGSDDDDDDDEGNSNDKKKRKGRGKGKGKEKKKDKAKEKDEAIIIPALAQDRATAFPVFEAEGVNLFTVVTLDPNAKTMEITFKAATAIAVFYNLAVAAIDASVNHVRNFGGSSDVPQLTSSTAALSFGKSKFELEIVPNRLAIRVTVQNPEDAVFVKEQVLSMMRKINVDFMRGNLKYKIFFPVYPNGTDSSNRDFVSLHAAQKAFRKATKSATTGTAPDKPVYAECKSGADDIDISDVYCWFGSVSATASNENSSIAIPRVSNPAELTFHLHAQEMRGNDNAIPVPKGNKQIMFMSHQQAEAEDQVLNLRSWLNAVGISTWVDKGAGITATKEGMKEGVRNSSIFFVFLTKSYFQSEFCRMELNEALKHNKPIMFVNESKPGHVGFCEFRQLVDGVSVKVKNADGTDKEIVEGGTPEEWKPRVRQLLQDVNSLNYRREDHEIRALCGEIKRRTLQLIAAEETKGKAAARG